MSWEEFEQEERELRKMFRENDRARVEVAKYTMLAIGLFFFFVLFLLITAHST